MSATTASAFLGVALGVGLWVTLLRLPFMRATTLTERITPQLRAYDTSSRLLRTAEHELTPFGPAERILAPLLRDARGWLGRFTVSHAALQLRLDRAAVKKAPLDFRAEQLLIGGALFAGTLSLAVIAVLTGHIPATVAILAALLAAVSGSLAREQWLSHRIRTRERKMLREFPGLAEMLALAVGAGANARSALERVVAVAQGELAGEFAQALADSRAGTPLLESLQNLARRVRLAPVERFVDGIVVASERGTPLAEVLRAQAQDVRDLGKRELMESAGRREIAMMVPVVFGVLPLTVIFAVFPGLAAITIML
ncbi:type II secretion system F family protein [Arthrobacter sp. NPDC090010]|uniref:type II secretion system F family protein n=1 Tax=Arthrobacter sp. NPDC090010 TaxID=3363942 RepID=UPI003807BB42